MDMKGMGMVVLSPEQETKTIKQYAGWSQARPGSYGRKGRPSSRAEKSGA